MADSEHVREPAGDVGQPRLTTVLWLVALAALVALSLWPSPGSKGVEVDPGQNVLWTLAHIPSYAVVVGLTVPLVYSWVRDPLPALLVSALFGIALGIALELLQPLVGRVADLADVALNVLGTFLAISFWTGGHLMSRRLPADRSRG